MKEFQRRLGFRGGFRPCRTRGRWRRPAAARSTTRWRSEASGLCSLSAMSRTVRTERCVVVPGVMGRGRCSMTCCRGRAPLLLLVATPRWSGAAWWFAAFSAPIRGSAAAAARSSCGFTVVMENLGTKAGCQTRTVAGEDERRRLGRWGSLVAALARHGRDVVTVARTGTSRW